MKNPPVNKDLIRLKDIIEAISSIEAVELASTSERKDFFAAAYLISVIGEASNHLSDEIKNKYANIPWRDIISMRNRLIHEYGKVNAERVLAVVKRDIPILKTNIEEIIQKEFKEK